MFADRYSSTDAFVPCKRQRIGHKADRTFSWENRTTPNHTDCKLSSESRIRARKQAAIRTSTKAETRRSSATAKFWHTTIPQAGIKITSKLKDLIERAISKAGKGCSAIKKKETNEGNQQCIYRPSCRPRFIDFYNWQRHIEISQPQNIWFCRRCGNIEHPTAKNLLTRKDKFLNHLRKCHTDWDNPEALMACKISYDAPFKKRCGFCGRNEFLATSFEHRLRHIMGHFKKGETMDTWTEWDENKDLKEDN
jgi:hypothetical protein